MPDRIAAGAYGVSKWRFKVHIYIHKNIFSPNLGESQEWPWGPSKAGIPTKAKRFPSLNNSKKKIHLPNLGTGCVSQKWNFLCLASSKFLGAMPASFRVNNSTAFFSWARLLSGAPACNSQLSHYTRNTIYTKQSNELFDQYMWQTLSNCKTVKDLKPVSQAMDQHLDHNHAWVQELTWVKTIEESISNHVLVSL